MKSNKDIQFTLAGLEIQLARHIDHTKIWIDGRVIIIKEFIDSVNDLRIILYPKDHTPPHFHVISKQRNIDARFSIKPIEFLSNKGGRVSKDDIKKIKNFFDMHVDKYKFLQSEYKRLQG